MNAMIFALPFPFSSTFSCDAASNTRARSSADTRSLPVATRETVATLTPATLATSLIVVFAALPFFCLDIRFLIVRLISTISANRSPNILLGLKKFNCFLKNFPRCLLLVSDHRENKCVKREIFLDAGPDLKYLTQPKRQFPCARSLACTAAKATKNSKPGGLLISFKGVSIMKSIIRLASSRPAWVFAVAFLVLLTVGGAQAQELRGKISGRVTDPNGAAVPGATVSVTDTARNQTVELTTNSDGLFAANYLLPGTYKVIVETAGFKKSIQDGVQVVINETRTLDIKLDIGTPQETVTIMEEAGQLNVADANLGQTIDRKRVDELPSIHGDPYTLINLSPGVTYTGSGRLDRPFEPTHIANFAMNGARGIRSDLLIDGAPSTATANANEVIASYVPPTDITQEFKVQTTTYDSQFGNTEGGVTSIAIKSGTNRLHGTAYYWIEPGGWAANDFFGNSRGQGRPFTFSNRPGVSISGPVTIPKVYNGKNKTFLLFAYEGIRDSRPRFDAS